MLGRQEFAKEFGRNAVMGMVHLEPLPGAPLYGGSMGAVIEAALADAHALAEGGCDAMLIENFGDRPFFKTAGPETVAAMTRAIGEVIREVTLPFGVNVLRNDPAAALAIAAATGARFIRVNVHSGAMLTDQGVIEGQAAETLRRRSVLAPHALIFADVLVKHAVPLAPVDDVRAAKDLRERGLADAVIISGSETGGAADVSRFRRIAAALDAPILIGSGVRVENAAEWSDADGVIVGTSLKRGRRTDVHEVARVVQAVKRR